MTPPELLGSCKNIKAGAWLVALHALKLMLVLDLPIARAVVWFLLACIDSYMHELWPAHTRSARIGKVYMGLNRFCRLSSFRLIKLSIPGYTKLGNWHG